jgi:CheY-like chemotaxis protein
VAVIRRLSGRPSGGSGSIRSRVGQPHLAGAVHPLVLATADRRQSWREVVALSPVGVLIVDDQEAFRRAAKAVIESTEGFTLLGVAASGEESLTAVAALRPDLVLMDVHMPGMDGFEATRRLTQMRTPPAVVLVSTYERGDYDDEVDGCGALAYLSKSDFSPSTLAAVWGTEAR